VWGRRPIRTRHDGDDDRNNVRCDNVEDDGRGRSQLAAIPKIGPQPKDACATALEGARI
jgi:hypothetical protein